MFSHQRRTRGKEPGVRQANARKETALFERCVIRESYLRSNARRRTEFIDTDTLESDMAEPAIRERMESIAFVQAENVPQPGLAAWVQSEATRWAPVVRASGASM
jgi:hypothetical protein